jgi:type IV pilus assembly protein PilA
MNKKGFTLIELLAVIIILAIIALIATPVVLNVVEKARQEAKVSSAYGVVDAAKYVYMESMMSSTGVVTSGNAADLKVSGEKPTAGTWTVNTSSTSTDPVITIDGVTFDNYVCGNKGATDGKVTCEQSK